MENRVNEHKEFIKKNKEVIKSEDPNSKEKSISAK